jgi:hypothetical protein
MNAGKVIYKILSVDSAVAALVGTRIQPFGADQTIAKPYITYQQISKVHNKHKDRDLKVQTIRMQVDMFATTYDGVSALADAVCTALSYKSGTYESIVVDIIVFDDENDLFSDQPEVFRKQQDYFLRIKT